VAVTLEQELEDEHDLKLSENTSSVTQVLRGCHALLDFEEGRIWEIFRKPLLSFLLRQLRQPLPLRTQEQRLPIPIAVLKSRRHIMA
jgi:hypothetical protein